MPNDSGVELRCQLITDDATANALFSRRVMPAVRSSPRGDRQTREALPAAERTRAVWRGLWHQDTV